MDDHESFTAQEAIDADSEQYKQMLDRQPELEKEIELAVLEFLNSWAVSNWTMEIELPNGETEYFEYGIYNPETDRYEDYKTPDDLKDRIVDADSLIIPPRITKWSGLELSVQLKDDSSWLMVRIIDGKINQCRCFLAKKHLLV